MPGSVPRWETKDNPFISSLAQVMACTMKDLLLTWKRLISSIEPISFQDLAELEMNHVLHWDVFSVLPSNLTKSGLRLGILVVVFLVEGNSLSQLWSGEVCLISTVTQRPRIAFISPLVCCGLNPCSKCFSSVAKEEGHADSYVYWYK